MDLVIRNTTLPDGRTVGVHVDLRGFPGLQVNECLRLDGERHDRTVLVGAVVGDRLTGGSLAPLGLTHGTGADSATADCVSTTSHW